jgi:hypothetical protein
MPARLDGRRGVPSKGLVAPLGTLVPYHAMGSVARVVTRRRVVYPVRQSTSRWTPPWARVAEHTPACLSRLQEARAGARRTRVPLGCTVR